MILYTLAEKKNFLYVQVIGSSSLALRSSSRNGHGVLVIGSGENYAKNSSLTCFAKICVLVDDTSEIKKFTRRYGSSDDRSIETTQIRSVNGPRINHVEIAQ